MSQVLDIYHAFFALLECIFRTVQIRIYSIPGSTDISTLRRLFVYALLFRWSGEISRIEEYGCQLCALKIKHALKYQ